MNLNKLTPPRKFNPRGGRGTGGQGVPLNDEEEQRLNKQRQTHSEEMQEHEKDKDKIKKLIQEYEVDLIVIGANKLEARQIKKVLSDIASKV